MTARVGVRAVLVMLSIACLLVPQLALRAAPPETKPKSASESKTDEAKPAAEAKRPESKPLGEHTLKGLQYLVNQQQSGGGWGQGGGWRQETKGGRVEGPQIKDPGDVGNTCVATLALIRAGNTAKSGPYAANVQKAVDFIAAHVESADRQSLYVTDVRDTQLQRKIGPYVDTFLAALVLSELKGGMPDAKGETRLLAALEKTIGKIESHQKEDGTFAGNAGWATILSQGLCSKALNRAKQQGVAVKEETLNRDLNHAVAGLDRKTGEFGAAGGGTAGGVAASGRFARAAGPVAAEALGGASDAGVEIYRQSAKASALQQRANSDRQVEAQAKEVLAKSDASKEEKAKAEADLKSVAENAEANDVAVKGLVKKLDDKRFIAGFGSNGGEEFLSYMNIGETLLVKGGTEFDAWSKSISDNLNRVQNKDGSWSGDHCITGRTFCTSAALLTLMADRAPVPPAEKK